MNHLLTDYKVILEGLASEGRLRTLRHEHDPGLLDCTSNDYMAIGSDEELRREFFESLNPVDSLPGSCASRLLYTSVDRYAELEDLLGSLYGREVLLYNSGYHCNVGLVSALAIKDTLIVSDKLVHASIIDGIRLSRMPFRRFAHNDIVALEEVLAKEGRNYRRVMVVVESVYSMDGDFAPLKELVELKKAYGNVMLYVDEAHGFGVLGDQGLGLAEETGVVNEIDILVGTLSKAAASVGAFAVVGDVLKRYLTNMSRPLIFSTAIPPMSVQWSMFTVRRLIEMRAERIRLKRIGEVISSYVAGVSGKGVVHSSPIIPLMIGGNERTILAAEIMRRHGVLALPIRRPTVAEGTERVRLSLNCSMTSEEINLIKEAVRYVAEEVTA